MSNKLPKSSEEWKTFIEKMPLLEGYELLKAASEIMERNRKLKFK